MNYLAMADMSFKLTPEDIEAAIASEKSEKWGKKTTLVMLTLKNDFEVIGTSSCVDPANYDHKVGLEIARKRAIDQVWLLEGYKMQEKMQYYKHLKEDQDKEY